MNVKDRVAVITGSGQGIGAGIAATLAHAWARVVVNDLDPARMEESKSHLEDAGVAVAGVASDVSTAEGAEALVQGALDAFGSIDIVVNNAGIARDKWLVKMTDDDWDDVLRINLKSQFLCVRAAAPHMMEQKWGRIVNISSRAWLGGPGQANYAASKGAVISLTRTLALEMARYNITANCIAPALVDTPLFQALDDEVKERLVKTIPVGRVGTPDDIGNAVLFFAAQESSYVTGQTLYVCGGRSLGAG
jgi:3-oxoacyl-[acyl-carrier protein] reductase